MASLRLDGQLGVESGAALAAADTGTDTDADAAKAALSHCLAQQVGLARQLLAALQAEARHLQNPGDVQALHASTRDKLACVQALEAASAATSAAIRDMRSEALQDHPDCMRQFQVLQALAEQARQLNAQNGMALQTCLRHTHHALLDLQQFNRNDFSHSATNGTGHFTSEIPRTTQPLYTAAGRMRLVTPALLTPSPPPTR